MRAGVVLLLGLAFGTGGCRSEGERPDGGDRNQATDLPAPESKTPDAVAEPGPDASWLFDALSADTHRLTESAHRVFGPATPVRVEGDLFVLVAADPRAPFDAAADFARQALAIYESRFFATLPDRAVTVYVFGSAAPFDQFRDSRSTAGCDAELGFYDRSRREIAVNVGPGLSTIAHELVHPLLQTDFPLAPRWLDEGIASLFEKPVFSPPGEIHGAKNWRYERLAQALASPSERGNVSLEAVFALQDKAFAGPTQGLAYAMARYACQWLDERGELWAFYRAWRDGQAEDRRGEKAFARVVGKTPAEASGEWVGWVKGMR